MLTKPVLGVLATRATETSKINGNCEANRRVANFSCPPGLGHGRVLSASTPFLAPTNPPLSTAAGGGGAAGGCRVNV